MNSYRNRTTLPQLFVALVATALIGSVALVGTVAAAPVPITTSTQA